jgi:hypothetical protein
MAINLNKADAITQIDSLINDNVSNEISEADVRETLKQNVQSNVNTNETAEQTMSGPLNMQDNDITNVPAFKRFNRNSYVGWHVAPTLTVNAVDDTQFDISAGEGVFVDLSDPSNTTPTTFTYPGATGIAGTLLGSASVRQTFVTINDSGTVVQRSTAPSYKQGEEELFIGNLTHGNDVGINDVFANGTETSYTDYSLLRSLRVFLRSFNGINLTGCDYTGLASLQLARSAGSGLVLGRNYVNDVAFPDTPSALGENPVATLIRKYEDTSGDLITITPVGGVIDPNVYNDNGVLTAVPNNNWTIMRIFFFYGSETTIVYVGNGVYSNLENARAGIGTETFEEHPDTLEAVFRGYLLVKEGATLLNDPAQAEFISVGGVRTFGISPGTAQFSTRQSVYNNDATVLVNTTNGPIRNQVDPGGSDGDLLLVGANTAGTITSTLTGNGNASFRDILSSNLIQFHSFANLAAFPTPAVSNRGAMAYDLNTGEMRYSDGTAWIPFPASGGGLVSAFGAQLLTSQTINLNSEDTMLYDNEIYDLDNEYDPVTGIFTAKRAGRYNFSAGAALEPSPAGGGRLRVRFLLDDGVTPVQIYSGIDRATAAEDQEVNISGDITLAIGDKVSVDVRWNFGAANATFVAHPACTFSGHYIG